MRSSRILTVLFATCGMAVPSLFAQTSLGVPRPLGDEPVAVGGVTVDTVFCKTAGAKPCWNLMPTNDQGASKVFFKQQSEIFAGAFRYRGLLGTTDTQSITADIVSDTMGWARIAVGTTLAKANDETGTMTPEEKDQEETIEQFFSSGGSLYANVELPILTVGRPEGAAFGLQLTFAPRLGLNVPELGSSTEEVNLNVDLALELRTRLSSDDNKIELFAGARYGHVRGTPEFYDGLGLSQDPFQFGQWSAGFILNRVVIISLDGDLTAPSVLDDAIKTRVSVAFFRSSK